MRSPKVTIDRTIDTSSLDTIVAGVIRPGMTNEEKALALFRWWRTALYHYGWPYQQPEDVEHWQDSIKAINVHGYGLCGHHARVFGWLATRVFGPGSARLIGYTEAGKDAWRLSRGAGAFEDSARLRGFAHLARMGHSSLELFYDGRWRLLDPHVQFYAYLRNGGGIAGAEDLIADPSLVTRPARRVPGLMPCGDLSRVFHASTFTNWGTITETTAPDRHVMDITLRRGETYTRYWDRHGPFVWFALMDERWDPEYLAPGPRHLCEGEECWRHYGNGELSYRPRLTDERYRDGVLEERNLAPTPSGLRTRYAGREGRVVFSVALPYMVCQATLSLDLTRATGSDMVRAWVRPAGGRWRQVWEEVACGRRKRTLDLSPWVVTKYGYEVRVDLHARGDLAHAVLHDLRLDTTFLLNYLVLPRLRPGRNRVTVEVAEPRELPDERLDVTYAWEDREGAHEHTERITSSPYRYEVPVAPVLTQPAENPKYMKYLRMRVR